VLAYFLLISLTNLVIGIVLGYFYGDLYFPPRKSPADAVATPHAELNVAAAPATSHDPTPAPAAVSPASPVADSKSPVASSPPVDDARPIKPTASREVSAADLADVMGELGIAPPDKPVEPAAAPSEDPKPSAPAPSSNTGATAITFEALTGEPEPLAG
jgi:hypothetical protein